MPAILELLARFIRHGIGGLFYSEGRND